MKQAITIALVGNPNVGKSTVFNALTGSNQHTGNWPGKTVAKKAGILKYNNQEVTIIDLPGTYSLSAYSMEEQITRDYIVDDQPQVVVDVVDVGNLERNLYLTTQILETGIPLILVLNMQDQVQSRGLKIDVAELSQRLGGTPVISMIASRGKGLTELKEAIMLRIKG